MIYKFQQQLQQGQTGELAIQTWLRRQGWNLRPVTLEEQKQGIDFWGTKIGDVATSFEIKTDKRAHRSGNAFVEVQSNSVTGKLGWLFTCQADFILYWIPGLSTLYWIQPRVLQLCYSDWKELYALRDIPNDGYHTTGLIVPLESFQTAATHKYQLGPQIPPAA